MSSEDLALFRTRLAYERTLMAWVRTALSLITFGFTVYKAFQFAREHGLSHGEGALTPRDFGLIMISIGVFSLATATVQYVLHLRKLKLPVVSVALVVSILFNGLGMIALWFAFFRE